MSEDGDARFGIGGAAAEQPSSVHGATERQLGPLSKVARRRGIDAGIEAKHGAGRSAWDLDQDGDFRARGVTQETRLQPIFREPGMDNAEHRLR